MDELIVNLDNQNELIKDIHAGQTVLLVGDILSARDAAHSRIKQLLDDGSPLPISLAGKLIYYLGPSPTRPNEVIGSCGPTSSYRMDKFYEMACQLGSIGSIGKGQRADFIRDIVVQYQSPYFVTYGGAAAFLAKCVRDCKCVGFEDLGAEAVYRLTLNKFPVVCAYDRYGKSVFDK